MKRTLRIGCVAAMSAMLTACDAHVGDMSGVWTYKGHGTWTTQGEGGTWYGWGGATSGGPYPQAVSFVPDAQRAEAGGK